MPAVAGAIADDGFSNVIFVFDRLLRRVPSIIEIWLLEFLTIIPLALAFGAWRDRIGLRVPDSGAMGFFAIVRQGRNPADPGVNHFANR
jgi:hypothetical protein